MTPQPTTTLARIKAANPCASSWKRALSKAGGLRKYGADTQITMRQIVEAMGLDDALWCLRTMPEHNARWRLLAVRYARRAQHLMSDPRSSAALDVAERHANGTATDEELSAAWAAARDAAGDAWSAARADNYAKSSAGAAIAASAAAWAAMDTASAVWDSARSAASAASRSATGDATWDAEREWQAAELIRICEDGKL